jgi:outer membrane receptor protein involved in Fe transport
MTRLLVCIALVLSVSSGVHAQTATVSGTVVDQSGGVVPGATVQLAGAAGRMSTVSGSQGEYGFREVAAGTYDVIVSLVGFAQATRSGVAVSSGDVQVPAIQLEIASVGETVVVTAAKIETALVDAPATMSVLSTEVLASTPAQNYGDLMRSVPGVNVIQLSARDVNITSRQSTSTLTNTQLVLLDGRSIYLDFFGLVLWDFLPTSLNDVKQIEVIRGPASAVWGANALTGVVNIITKSPRESVGTNVTLSAGLFSRDAGSTRGEGVGTLYGANATYANAPTSRLSYRLSAGYFNSEALPRPTGQIPVVPDPRNPAATVGGASYPADADSGTPGLFFKNQGTSQPKFDVRLDQELEGGSRLTYQGGFGGTQGIIHSGIGPFDIQNGSYMGYGKVNYSRAALRVNFFANLVSAEAPNLLLTDAATNAPLQLNFNTQTYDFELGHAIAIGSRNGLSYGGNIRRNNFDLTIAPAAEDRTELGAYVQDEIILDRVRFTIGGRVDKFGNLEDPVFSPRLAAVVKVTPEQSVRVSFNRAFRSPSMINNYLDASIYRLVNLSALAPFVPAALQPIVLRPFPLVVKAVGSEVPIGGVAQGPLKEEVLDAYEVAYTGTFNGRTTLGVAFYVNDLDDNINFVLLPTNRDPYTAANPPPGWAPLPTVLIAGLAQQGVFLPRTAFTYLNLGPMRQKGLELSVDHRVSDSMTAFVNYSWQADPEALDDPNPFPAEELSLPPTNRFNAGFNVDGSRFLGSASVNYSDKGFWTDVLDATYHGVTDAYTLVNGSFGMKWQGGRVTTLIKMNNILNQEIQQHVFGDIITRSAIFEVRLKM